MQILFCIAQSRWVLVVNSSKSENLLRLDFLSGVMRISGGFAVLMQDKHAMHIAEEKQNKTESLVN